ncbi:hypothetical protein DRQ33_06085, partial [bacterium]
HKIKKKRAEKEKFQGTRLGARYTDQENRRVEISANLIGENRFNLQPDEVPSDSILNKIVTKLANNPEVILVVRASTIKDALEYKEILMEHIPTGWDYEERVFSQDGIENGVELVLTGTGLIYRPPQVIQPAQGYEIEPGWDKVYFSIKPNASAGVSEANIYITKNGDIIEKFDTMETFWDWNISGGELPAPGNEFRARGEVIDTFGQKGITSQERLPVLVKNINEVQQRLILLQFAFAGERSESEFTNARMEYVAQRVIERIEAGNVDVIVAGHTDTVGTFAGNRKLSLRRANEQLQILRKYLKAILSFDSDSTLNRWIAKNNSRLIAKGFGMSEPFKIIRLQDDEEVPIKVGINTLPEGRIKNRRVEIHFIPRKEKNPKPQAEN